MTARFTRDPKRDLIMSASVEGSSSTGPSCCPSASVPETTGDKMVRYDALFKLTEELLAAETLETTCAAAARHLKYIADAAAWRLIVPWDDGFAVMDGQRGGAVIYEVAELPDWDATQWRAMLPAEFRREALTADNSVPHLLVAPGLCRVSVMPIHRNGKARGLMFAASRTPAGSPLESKFLYMAGALLADQVLGQLTHRQEVEMLEQAAGEDILTGSMNRRALLQTLRRQIATHHRSGLPIGVLMVDVDHFKSINDRYGHPAGDEVLRSLARRLAGAIRDDDYLGRFGGEEFVVIVYPCPGDVAQLVGERLRKAVARTPFRIESAGDPFDLPVTISVGGALFEGLGNEAASEEELIKIADAALYESKTNGRNRVTVHRPGLDFMAIPAEVAE